MKKIEIIDQVRLRFPKRDVEFDLGVEVGAVSVLLAQGTTIIERELSEEALEQLRPIAESFCYRLTATELAPGLMRAVFSHASRRPLLRLV
jgi:hypothetical protein